MPHDAPQVTAAINSLPGLADIMTVFVAFLLLFSVITTSLWNGLMSFRCVNDETGEVSNRAPNLQVVHYYNISNIDPNSVPVPDPDTGPGSNGY